MFEPTAGPEALGSVFTDFTRWIVRWMSSHNARTGSRREAKTRTQRMELLIATAACHSGVEVAGRRLCTILGIVTVSKNDYDLILLQRRFFSILCGMPPPFFSTPHNSRPRGREVKTTQLTRSDPTEISLKLLLT